MLYIAGIYSRDPNKNTCAQTFFWKKVHPVRPFMGPVRLEKFGSKKKLVKSKN